jgi:hypothetical protein
MGIRSSLGRRCRESLISSEEIEKRMFGMFYRKRNLVIDGKYNSNDGLSTAAMINRQREDKSRKIK